MNAEEAAPELPDPAALPLFRSGGDTRSRLSARPGAGPRRVADVVADAPTATVSATASVSVHSRAVVEAALWNRSLSGPGPRPPDQDGGGHRPTETDWRLVTELRDQAANRLSHAIDHHPGNERGHGAAIIRDLLIDAEADRLAAGEPEWTPRVRAWLTASIGDALFGLGRLQPLVDDDRVENIIISGYDRVVLDLVDGTQIPGPAVANSDQELIEFLVFLASRSEVNARPFSEAQPRLHLRLDGGARLAAAAWVTPRPSVVIRRHRLRQVRLADLVERGSVSPVMASFLAAAVRGRRSVVVSGPQGAGKTTMLRALCAEIGPQEAIGTFETEYELHLHEMPEQHPIVHAWEARPGSGERGPDGRQAGEFRLDDALIDSFRFNLSRQIVGEVRGPEVLSMFKAMDSSAGSLSSTHAYSAEAAIRKLITCALEAGPQISLDYATSTVAANIDVIVQLHYETVEGSRERWVEQIITVGPGESMRGYATTTVFRRREGGPAVAGTLDDSYRSLVRYGFDLDAYTTEQQLFAGADR